MSQYILQCTDFKKMPPYVDTLTSRKNPSRVAPPSTKEPFSEIQQWTPKPLAFQDT